MFQITKRIFLMERASREGRLELAADNLLKRGLNFAISPKTLPVDDIVVATEDACGKMREDEVASLRAKVTKQVKRAIFHFPI